LAAATFGVVAQALPTEPVLLDLARVNLSLGRYSEAEAAFRRLAELDPDRDLLAQHGRIWCRIKRRDWRGALQFALYVAKADRYDLTTALLAYAKDRLFTRVSDADAAARELLEETGWRPARVEHLVTFQPMVGSADSANHVYAAFDCVQTDEAIDMNEAVEVRWVPLHEASEMVKTGEVIGAASVVAISQLEARAATQR
jgi:8-oxo-dGTP pyrophosphatase MutT (NUDIX family)